MTFIYIFFYTIFFFFFLLISSADMDDDDFKKMVLKDILITLQQKGFDIDPGNKRIGSRGWVVVAIFRLYWFT